MANDRTEIAQTVKTASRARRPMYASIAAPSNLSVLPVERRRPRDARRLAVRAVVHARRDVAHVVLHHAHTHGRRALADDADDEALLRGDPPDVLAELDALLLRHTERLLPLVHQLLHPRLGALALRAAGGGPL